ncbi:hypothetical protein SORBI_3010G079850 [Sorghum bicolor]|uniref:Uncharacterized protein n=1 Tax=Sorghum bicolor TaxID=4558 RepID=A0A1W0VRX7_SORBI|nr:hypothetical protein SORBI_3010G079850 [Sorghum bicolor]
MELEECRNALEWRKNHNQSSAKRLQIKAEGICDGLLVATPERSCRPNGHVEEDEPLMPPVTPMVAVDIKSDDVSSKKKRKSEMQLMEYIAGYIGGMLFCRLINPTSWLLTDRPNTV